MNCSICGIKITSSQNNGSKEDPLCSDCLKMVESSSVLTDNDEICDKIEDENKIKENSYKQKVLDLDSGDKLVTIKDYLTAAEANHLKNYFINSDIFAKDELSHGGFLGPKYYRVTIQEKDTEIGQNILKEYDKRNNP